MKSKWLSVASVGVPLGLTCLLLAQSAQLSGLVTDPADLPVPNATLYVQNHETCATRGLVTNQKGLLQLEESAGS